MNLLFSYAFALLSFLYSGFITESYQEKIKRQIGNSNSKKVDMNNLRVFSFQLDSIAIIPVKGKDWGKEFLFYDINENECFWVTIYPGGKELNNLKVAAIHISSANHLYKKILYLDVGQRMVVKQETFKNNRLNSAIQFFDSDSKLLFDFAITPVFMGLQGVQDSNTMILYLNLDWINVSKTFPRNLRKEGTFINRFISFDDKERKIVEIEFEN